MNEIAIKAKDEIVKLHEGIITSARRSVSDAIRIGEILSEQKEMLPHGQFLPWVETLPFNKDTSYRYINLFLYADKIRNVRNLQEAYKQIETIESQERRTEEQKRNDLIRQYERTGKKPDGWDRSLDYAYKKKKAEDEAYEMRKQEAFKQSKEQDNERQEYEMFTSVLKDATEVLIKKEKERATWKEKIRISASGKEDQFIDAILEYLETLADDNRRIEACQNIIKICKNIAVELQKVKHG